MIKKVKGGYVVAHCHGADKGKRINKSPVEIGKALAIHAAIKANKRR